MYVSINTDADAEGGSSSLWALPYFDDVWTRTIRHGFPRVSLVRKFVGLDIARIQDWVWLGKRLDIGLDQDLDYGIGKRWIPDG